MSVHEGGKKKDFPASEEYMNVQDCLEKAILDFPDCR